MRRLAVAVLLFLFVISSAVPSMASPIAGSSNSFPFASENPGVEVENAQFDLFAQTLSIGADPLKHLVADLNNDSRPDVAVIYENSPTLDIFFGDADYQYSTLDRTTRSMANHITDIAVGDMDNDGLLDLVASLNSTSNNVVILNQVGGYSLPGLVFTTSLRPFGIALNDFDGDLYLDVATLISTVPPTYNSGFEIHFHSESYGTKVLATYLHTAPLNFQIPRLFISGDFNDDGRVDLVIGDHGVGRIAGFLNGNVNGLDWSSYSYFNITGPTSVVLQQLDGTGVSELTVGADLGQRVQIRRFTGSSFSLYTEIQNEPGITSLAFMDRNGDARLDLVRASDQYHNLTVFTASSTLTYGYTSSISFPVPLNPSHIIVADMSPGDSYDDIVLISGTSGPTGSLTIYYQNPTTISNANDNQLVKDLQPSLTTMGDFDGNGVNEIAAYDGVQKKVRFLNEGNSFLAQRNAPENVTAMLAKDLDGDGRDDLIMVALQPAALTIWYGASTFMSGGGTVTVISSSLGQAYEITAEDLNNDGLMDLAVAGQEGIDVFFASSLAPRFDGSRHQIVSLTGAVISYITAASFDSHVDGLIDIAVVNETSSRVEIYYQQTGATKFLPGSMQLLNVLPGISTISSADMNGDGASDILASTIEGVSLYLQSPTFAHGFSDSQDVYVLDVPEDLEKFSTGDLDDDGEMELAVATASSTVLAYGFSSLTFQLITRQTTGASPLLLMTDDADGDLKDDIVAYSIPSRAVSFYYQNNFAPVAAGMVEGTGHLEGAPVWFNADASTDNYSDQDRLAFSWNFGDGATGSGNRTSHVFLDNGTYDVVLNVSDPSGMWDTVIIHVNIGDRTPVADFSYSGALVEGSPIQFTDLSTSPADEIVSWSWDFGDGQWSNQTNNASVQHAFSRNETFTVTLTVLDEDGSSDSASYDITVLDSAPVADFSASNYAPIEGQTVTFTDLSTFTADNIVSWSWDLGDGTWENRTTGDPFAHTYTYNGTYQVTLVVQDIDGSEDTVSKSITIQDSAPVAGFSTSIASPFEGDEVTFTDTSLAPVNEIVSWSWDLGDGTVIDRTTNASVLHTYADNGTYYVALTVTDVDGNANTISRTMVVRDTSPVVSTLYIVGGGSSFKEWDKVVLEVVATPHMDPIVHFQWSFDTVDFQIAAETLFNTTSYRYNASDTYRIFVRVWDSDSYTESSIQITITDPAPVPDFTPTANVNDRTVIFSADLTLDTENDQPWLRYRWNFGDGQQTDWSYSNEVNHTYDDDGAYSVRLEVRDDHNTAVIKTRNVTIDLLPPEISMEDPVLKAVVGEPTLIKVNVTDLVGIGSVVLEYTIGNITRTVAMTHEGGGIYFAQIPAQNKTMEITYRIVAEDMAGHSATTEEFTLALEYEDPSLFIYSSLALLMAFLVIIIYLFLSRPIVDEVFVLYHDGTLLAHQTRRLKPGMDDEILGGMLIALQSFVRDSFKDENSTVLRRMDFGERKLLVERKDDFFMAVMLSGKRAGNAATRMMKVLDNIEETYAPVLKEWDGDLEKVRGIRDETKPMFSRANPLDRLKRKEGEDDSI